MKASIVSASVSIVGALALAFIGEHSFVQESASANTGVVEAASEAEEPLGIFAQVDSWLVDQAVEACVGHWTDDKGKVKFTLTVDYELTLWLNGEEYSPGYLSFEDGLAISVGERDYLLDCWESQAKLRDENTEVLAILDRAISAR